MSANMGRKKSRWSRSRIFFGMQLWPGFLLLLLYVSSNFVVKTIGSKSSLSKSMDSLVEPHRYYHQQQPEQQQLQLDEEMRLQQSIMDEIELTTFLTETSQSNDQHVFRNLNPFGVSVPSSHSSSSTSTSTSSTTSSYLAATSAVNHANDFHSANQYTSYCASGPLGQLQRWVQLVDPSTSKFFYYCKDTKKSQWESPCSIFKEGDNTKNTFQIMNNIKEEIRKQDILSSSGVSIKQMLEGALSVQEFLTLNLNHVLGNVLDDEAFCQRIIRRKAELAEKENLLDERTYLFTDAELFKYFERLNGEFDDLAGLLVHAFFPRVFPSLEGAIHLKVEDIQTVELVLKELINYTENDLEKRNVYGYDPNNKFSSNHSSSTSSMDETSSISQEDATSQLALAMAWADMGKLMLLQGFYSYAIDCFRRSIYWRNDHIPSLLSIALLLKQFEFRKDSCTIFQRMLQRTHPDRFYAFQLADALQKHFGSNACEFNDQSGLDHLMDMTAFKDYVGNAMNPYYRMHWHFTRFVQVFIIICVFPLILFLLFLCLFLEDSIPPTATTRPKRNTSLVKASMAPLNRR